MLLELIREEIASDATRRRARTRKDVGGRNLDDHSFDAKGQDRDEDEFRVVEEAHRARALHRGERALVAARVACVLVW